MSAQITCAAPFLIVRDLPASIAFYRDLLGFDVTFSAPETAPFFAVIQRGGAMVMLKEVDADPEPNPTRDPEARWDIFFSAPDPSSLAAEYSDAGVAFRTPVGETHDGLVGFELADPDGHVLFFGSPVGGGQ